MPILFTGLLKFKKLLASATYFPDMMNRREREKKIISGVRYGADLARINWLDSRKNDIINRRESNL